MKVTLERIDDAYLMRTTNEAGRFVDADGSPDIGGGDQAMRPMQMVLSALASCSTIDVIFLLRKQRQDLQHIKVEIEGKRVDTVPRVFTDIHLHYHLWGAIDAKKADRACRLSMEELCSVSKMLEKSVNITWEFTIHP